MKKVLSTIFIGLLCLSMFPMFAPHVKADLAYLTDIVQLTTNPYDDRGAGWFPDSSKITYGAFADSWYRHIWVMNRDGSGKTQLTFGDVVDEGPVYSPDGSKIVFTRYGLRGWGIHDIFIMNADGSGTPEQITSTGLARLSVKWSNDGQRLAFYYGGAGTSTNEIHIMNADGTNEVTVVSSASPQAAMNTYWSPDDKKLVYTMDDGIWTVNTSPPYQTTHVFQTSSPTTYAVYSPDGNYIMYASGVYGQLQDLYLIDVSGNFIAQLTYDTKFGYGFDWSPDGEYIAFNSISSGNYDIWRARIVIEGAGARSPVGYWKFDDGSGATALDSSGNGNTGTLTSSPQWVNGIAGTSLEFDGIDDVVMVPSSSSLVVAHAHNQLTLETWMKPTVTLDSNTVPMYLMTKGNEYGFELTYKGTPPIQDGKIRFCMGFVDPSTHYILPEEIFTTTDVWTAGTWYHLVGTYDGESMKIYVNGVLENSLLAPGTMWTQEPDFIEYPLSIAAYTWGMPYIGNLYFFKGILDEIKVYNYARTAEEILSDYNSVSGSLFEDDFENYVVGTFPSSGGWELVYNGAGSQYQIVTDAYCNSPIKSLQLLGTNGWSANVQREFTSDSSLLGYEAYMLAQSNTGPANHVGQAAFWNLQGAPWGKRFAVVQFGEDGNLYTAPIHLGPVYVNMGPYEANRWYHVKVLIDRDAGKYSVWIDDSLKAVDIAIPDTYEINALELESGHAGVKVFFDDVRVFTSSAPPPSGQNPVAVLHLDDTVHNIGADVWFYGDQSYDPDGGRITSYIFDFDDQTPNAQVYWPQIGTTHQYTAAGEYWTRMKVIDDEGMESDWTTEKLTILPAPGFPTAILTVYPNPQKVGGILTFDASQSNDPDGISEYGFDFGDGTPIVWTSSPTTTHSYSEIGDYYARVCVSDDTGLETWSLKQRITIRNEEPPQPTTLKVTIQSNPPTRTGTIPFAVTFTATPSGGKGYYTISWLVESSIGGTWSSVENPLIFNFKYSDTYTVKATATCSGTSDVATAQMTIVATGTIYEAKFTLWSGIVQAGTNNPLVSLEYNNIQNLGYFTVRGSSVSLKTGVRVSFNGPAALPDWLFDLIGISAPWYSIQVKDSAGTVDAAPLVQLKAGTATPIDVTLPLGTPTTIEWGYMLNFSASPTSARALAADLVSCVFAVLGLNIGPQSVMRTVFEAVAIHLEETAGAQLLLLPTMSIEDQWSLIHYVINDVLTYDYLISLAASVGGDLARNLMTVALRKIALAWTEAIVLSDLGLFLGATYRGDLWDEYYVSQATPMLYACIDPPEIINAVLNTPYGAVGYRDGSWVNEGNFSGFYHSEILNNTYGFGIPVTASEYCADLTLSSASGNSIPYVITLNWMNETSVFQGNITAEARTFGIEVFGTGEMTAVAWEYIFKDTRRGTVLKISTDDRYFQFTSPGKDFGVRNDPKMIFCRNTIVICYNDKEIGMAAIATTGKTIACTATLLDKQTRKLYVLISCPSCR